MFEDAHIEMYVKWLRGWMDSGHRPTHYYNYPWSWGRFLLAKRDFRLAGECGARSRSILVPSNVQFLGGDLGHCNLYFQEKFEIKGSWAPVYDDPVFLLIPSVADAIAAFKVRDEKAAIERETWSEKTERLTKTSDLQKYLRQTSPHRD